ncbi:MAG: DUF5107 domain-containing protein, partial [Treponema sp.]|nr:DUF5107 domain-containing protein [Treponema sp.]
MKSVKATVENMVIPTYEAAEYEEFPMFTVNRGHQGAKGNSYPQRIINRTRRDRKVDKTYAAVHLENDYIDVIILPELGGRIFAARDKTNGYDFFYRHNEIKPGLIGIFGLWISGGLEFNWPRHHRAATFFPSDFSVEHTEGGGVIVWMSDHDPLVKMKGMVGVALYPDRAILETKVKLFNRTPVPHGFHWWENAGIPVNDTFQVFFPPDVTYVNYHNKKAVGAYPVMDGYFCAQDNRGGTDIRFYRNAKWQISYFCGLSKYDFFGGYDHGKKAGLIHYSSHHTSVGKKMFAWGDCTIGRIWQDCLTDTGGDYVELMASSYGDNQPDFSWLEPWEVKEFSQIWYPFKEIGQPLAASDRAAIVCEKKGGDLELHVYTTEDLSGGVLEIGGNGIVPITQTVNLKAAIPQRIALAGRGDLLRDGLTVTIRGLLGDTLLAYTRETPEPYVPEPVDDPLPPDRLASADDCCAAGLHADLYYDAAFEPEVWWKKGLEFDPRHAGCLVNLGRFYLGRQNYDEAEGVLRRAVHSLTRYDMNPRDCEALYLLGLVLAVKGRDAEALELLYKALWNRNQIIPGSCEIAVIYGRLGEYQKAEGLLRDLVRQYGRNQRAVELLIVMLRKQGKTKEALEEVKLLLEGDRLDILALNELRLLGDVDPLEERFRYRRDETGLDLAADYASMGLYGDGLDLLNWIAGKENPTSLLLYAMGYLESLAGGGGAAEYYARAEKAPGGMRFASLDIEARALENAIALRPGDGRPRLELGNLLYGVRRQADAAIAQWRAAGDRDPASVHALRNLAIALINKNNRDREALILLDRAVDLRPGDSQLLWERNLAMELENLPPRERYETFKAMKASPEDRDALFLQGIHILNQMGERRTALELIESHIFLPAEGADLTSGSEYGASREGLGYAAGAAGAFEEALSLLIRAGIPPVSRGG